MNKIAHYLLDIKAVQINTENKFTWASGIKSPIYTDNRLIMSYPKIRSKIIVQLSKLIKNKFPEVDFVVGTSTAGIPHAAFVSIKLKLPMGYVRGSAKTHGKNNSIEGKILPENKIVVIEDLFSTGRSSLEVVNKLKEKGYNVLGIVSIFSYELDILEETFKDVEHYSLLTISELLKEASVSDILQPIQIKEVKNFIKTLYKN